MWHEKLFASLFATSSEPILVVERTGRRIVDCNAAVEALFAWPRAEIIGKSTALLAADPEAWQGLPRDFFAAMDAGRVAELRMAGRRRDGAEFPARVRGTSFDHEGKIYNVIFITDLTEIEDANRRLRAEANALRERVKELQCIYRVSDILAETSKPLDDRIGRLPPHLKAAWQFSEIAQVRIVLRGVGYATPGDAPLAARQSSEIKAKGVPVGTITIGYTGEKPRAAEGPFLEEERRLLDDVARRIGAAVERDDEEIQRRISEARLRFLSDTLPLSIAVSDWETGAYLYANAHARRELGLARDTPIDHLNIRDFYVDADDRPQVRAQLERDGRLQEYTLRVRVGADVRWNVLYAEMIEFDGRRAAYFVRIDVTEQRIAEETRRRTQRLETIGQLAGGVAHDFNNVLTALAMQFDLLREEAGLSPEARNGIEIASTAVDRGAAITRQLLGFARQVELKPDRVDIAHQVGQMRPFLSRTLGGHIAVAVESSGEALWGFVDRGLLESAILNLAINARDAMPSGGTLKIAVAPRTEPSADGAAPADYVEVAVADSGVGMPPEILDRAFEPFFTTKEVGRGTGLGLSMVHGFVKQSGGFARIESKPGAGTTVRLYFPRRGDLGDAAAAPRAEAGVAGVERLLLVDDDDMVRQSVARQLAALGYRVAEAGSGTEALRLIDVAPPDLVITDIMMPDMLGTDLAMEMRKRSAAIPILMISGNAEEDYRQALRSLPRVEFMDKPFASGALAAKVRDLLLRFPPAAPENVR